MIPTTAPALRIGNLFNRRHSTPWSDKEIRAYKKLYKAGCFANMKDLELIERYYAFERRKGDKGIHRRDLFTFLNNYSGELDRARAWENEKRPRFNAPVRYEATDGVKPCSDSEFERIGQLARAELEKFRAKLQAPQVSEPKEFPA